MSSIFLGLILIFFDFTFNADGHILSFLPTFAGYICINVGLRKIEKETNAPIKPMLCEATIGMTIFMIIKYAMDLFGLTSALASENGSEGIVIIAAIQIAITLGEAYIMYGVLDYILKIEVLDKINLLSGGMRSDYNVAFISAMVSIVTSYIPGAEIVAVVAVVISFIAKLVFLMDFSKSKKIYYES